MFPKYEKWTQLGSHGGREEFSLDLTCKNDKMTYHQQIQLLFLWTSCKSWKREMKS